MSEQTPNPILWQKPKHDAAAYVASKGFHVPRTFYPKEAAEYLSYGGAVIARSELGGGVDGDLCGPAGILDSWEIHPSYVQHSEITTLNAAADLIEPKLRSAGSVFHRMDSVKILADHFPFDPDFVMGIFDQMNRGSGNLKAQAKIQCVPLEQLQARVSTTLWELVRGTNTTVTRDPQVPDMLHIFSRAEPNPTTGIGASDYVVYQNGTVDLGRSVLHGTTASGPQILSRVEMDALAEVYRGIAGLPAFKQFVDQAPIMELQVATGQDGKPAIYFLQYRVGAKTSPPVEKPLSSSDFLESDGWVPATRLRGATPGGKVIEAQMGLFPPPSIETMRAQHVGALFTRGPIMSGVANNVLPSYTGCYVLDGMPPKLHDISHGAREPFIRPQISMLVHPGALPGTNDNLIRYQKHIDGEEGEYSVGSGAIIPIAYASDGRRGFVRRR